MAADAVRDRASVDPIGEEDVRATLGADSNPEANPSLDFTDVEPREASGLTSRLLLAYVERVGGVDAVAELLERAGLSDREPELRDENCWFADSTRIRLFELAAEVLDDPLVARHVGEAALDLNVGQALKLTLRTLGSPRLIYSNIGRANAKFNRVHRMDTLELTASSARVRNVPLEGIAHHPVDCQYNIGLLSCVPQLFGRAPARVRHSTCIGTGASECVYEVEWSTRANLRSIAALGAVSVAALAASMVAVPALLPLAAAGTAGAGALAGRQALTAHRRRWWLLEAQLREQAEVAERLTGSLHDLVSALDVDEVLSKVARNAQAALGGVEFVLLVEESGLLECRGSSAVPDESLAALERWAQGHGGLLERSLLIDDLTGVSELNDLASHPRVPLGSLCAAPVVYRERPLGVLLALANGVKGFLAPDVALLESYAAQVAIALTNARMYRAQQELATRDPLTGLLNHREFHELLARELEWCRRHGGELGVVLLDLDDFKLVNDTGGHAAGDAVLRRVATSLADSSRASDAVFRVGGDEFALVLPGTGLQGAEAAARRARDAIDALDIQITTSWGAAAWPSAGPTKDALLARADAALYAAKRAAAGLVVREPIRPGPQALTSARRRERLASASRIAAKLAPLHDPAEIARTAVEDLHESFGDFIAAISRLDTDGELKPIAAAGLRTERLPAHHDWLGPVMRAVSERALRTGEPALVPDAERDLEISRDRRLQGRSAGGVPGSDLATPIRVDGEIWGVLALERSERNGFDSDDVLFADTIGASVGAAIHRSQLFGELEGTFMRTLEVLSDTLEAKDAYTAAHARHVADLAFRVGTVLRMEAAELRTLHYAALLHDIGKIGVPSEILGKPGALTDEEFEQVQRHSTIGADLLDRIPYFADVQPLVRAAHERWDGDGYPDGLRGEAIPLGARIIGACDAFHAMTSDRPYRRAMPVAAAAAQLREHAGTQFDAAVVDALLELVASRPSSALGPSSPRLPSSGRLPSSQQRSSSSSAERPSASATRPTSPSERPSA